MNNLKRLSRSESFTEKLIDLTFLRSYICRCLREVDTVHWTENKLLRVSFSQKYFWTAVYVSIDIYIDSCFKFIRPSDVSISNRILCCVI